jgi:hypothetical protein
MHKINNSSCLGFTLNKQQSAEKLVARQYMYLMDRLSLERNHWQRLPSTD